MKRKRNNDKNESHVLTRKQIMNGMPFYFHVLTQLKPIGWAENAVFENITPNDLQTYAMNHLGWNINNNRLDSYKELYEKRQSIIDRHKKKFDELNSQKSKLRAKGNAPKPRGRPATAKDEGKAPAAEAPKPRGRPATAKNKGKAPAAEAPKPRGRPATAKNKGKAPAAEAPKPRGRPVTAKDKVKAPAAEAPKPRGRPATAKNKGKAGPSKPTNKSVNNLTRQMKNVNLDNEDDLYSLMQKLKTRN